MQITDTLLVSYTFNSTSDIDSAVLIVGKKDKKKPVEIVNAFQGEEAIDIWKKLTEVKKGLDE